MKLLDALKSLRLVVVNLCPGKDKRDNRLQTIPTGDLLEQAPLVATTETCALTVPHPSEFANARATWQESNQSETRKAFFSALPTVRDNCLAQIKRQYAQNHDDSVLIYLPREMWKRKDLIDTEIVSWLHRQGWSASHRWGSISDEYCLFIRPC